MKLTILALTVVAATLTLAGCSYQPARIDPEPIIEIGDGEHHGGHGGGGFCPPGQAKKGRC
ncbi:hypothetical protein [Onishia niordana]|uniref:hypothetical protein n=1 Tax=Onishia niordana TaxID=2508711 RepID=UPI0010A0BC42|nr:hypothetical protein [Halomonas niordiana]